MSEHDYINSLKYDLLLLIKLANKYRLPTVCDKSGLYSLMSSDFGRQHQLCHEEYYGVKHEVNIDTWVEQNYNDLFEAIYYLKETIVDYIDNIGWMDERLEWFAAGSEDEE